MGGGMAGVGVCKGKDLYLGGLHSILAVSPPSCDNPKCQILLSIPYANHLPYGECNLM